MLFLALAPCLLLPVAPQQVLNEVGVIETGLEPGGLEFVNGLELDGDWLAAGGSGGWYEHQMLWQRDGLGWIQSSAPWAGGFVEIDGPSYASAIHEYAMTRVFRWVLGSWALETEIRDQYLSLDGERLLTHSFLDGQAASVSAWRRESAGWTKDGLLVPPAAQVYAACCYPTGLSGETAAFIARGSSGDQAVHVFTRQDAGWSLEAELVPAEFRGNPSGDCHVLALDGDTLAAIWVDRTTATAFVWERARGAWQERLRIPGPVWSLALEGDTLVLGMGFGLGVALVYERSQGTWVQSARLAAASGQAIGRAVALEGRQVVCSTLAHFPPSESRIFFFELPPFPRLTTYGCGINPAGSLTVLAGAPVPGGSVRLGLDNPLGTQAPGALALLGLSSRPDPGFPCGSRVPRAGMAGGSGELLVAGDALVNAVGLWHGPGRPVETEVLLPANLALVGRTLYLQGALLDLRPRARVPLGLTEALELEIGPSVP